MSESVDFTKYIFEAKPGGTHEVLVTCKESEGYLGVTTQLCDKSWDVDHLQRAIFSAIQHHLNNHTQKGEKGFFQHGQRR